jgi:hypothetical protein
MPPEKSTQIETAYPSDPGDLPSVYCNHVNIQYLPEEVYLDLATVQIQAVSPSDVQNGMVMKVPALAHTRVIMSRAHAKRLAMVILQTLGVQTPVPDGEVSP